MAGSSERGETEFLQSIQRQINSFSGGLSEGDLPSRSFHVHGSALNVDALHTAVQKCEEELQQLEQEIVMLDADHAKAAMGKEEQILALNDIENLLPRTGIDEGEIEAEATQIAQEIDQLAKITDLRFYKVTHKVIDIGDNFLKKQQLVEGSCHNMDFKIKFDADETWGANGISAKLRNIKVKVPDADKDTLVDVLASLQSYDSLTLIFRALLSYAKWKSQKEKLFIELTESYPESVVPVDTNTLIVMSQQNTRCEWRFIFTVVFSQEGRPTPSASLLLKLPEDCLEDDTEDIYRSAPSKYKLMQSVLGVPEATKILIQTILE